MADGPHLVGIDHGTSGARVGIFDREGTPAVFQSVEFGTSYPRPAWAEQARRVEQIGDAASKVCGHGAVSAE